MSPDHLSRIEERLNAATPGPWRWAWPSDVVTERYTVLAQVRTIGAQCRVDAEFLANARQDMADLASALRLAWQKHATLKSDLAKARVQLKRLRRLAAVKRLLSREASPNTEQANE